MRFTNKYDLPEPLVLAAAGSDHRKTGKYSLTQLLKSPQQVALENRYVEEKGVEDVSSRLWAMLGSGIHSVIEKSGRFAIADRREDGTFRVIPYDGPANPHFIKELHLSVQVRVLGQLVTVSGTPDHFDTDILDLADWKVTTAYSFCIGGKDEWEQQLNLQSFFLTENGYPQPKRLLNYLILRDYARIGSFTHKVLFSKFGDKYPPVPFVRIESPLWKRSQQAEFLRERVHLHETYQSVKDKDLPECDAAYRWNKDLRCNEYCSAAPWCQQRKKILEAEAAAVKTGELESAGVAKSRKKKSE